jgi:hypothetical protein
LFLLNVKTIKKKHQKKKMNHHNRMSLGIGFEHTNILAQEFNTRRSLSFLSKDLVIAPNKLLYERLLVNALTETLHRHDINGNYLKYLMELRNFKLVIICDDSISMKESNKWTQLRDTIEIMLDLVNKLKIECDLYFTNRLGYRNIRSFSQLKTTFNVEPSGSIRRFTDLFDLAINYNRLELIKKKLHIIMFVDGAPTPKLNDRFSTLKGLKHVLKYRESIDRVFVTVTTCNKNDCILEMFNKWDKSIKNFTIINEFDSEQREILRQNYLYLSFGDYVSYSI